VPAGVHCALGPSPVALPVTGTVVFWVSLSADPAVLKGPAQVQIVAALAGNERRYLINVVPPSAPPTEAGDSLLVYGCAGYPVGVGGAGSPSTFLSTFVGAWKAPNPGPYRQFCSEVLGESDGWFALEVPYGCVQEGGGVYLSSGGYPGCASVPFHRGGAVFAEVVGVSQGQTCPGLRAGARMKPIIR
jgi:hypothetical protein